MNTESGEESKYDLTKIAVVRALSPQTRVSSLRSLEYSADLDELLADISDDRIESILRRHKIRFPKRKVKAVRLVRSIYWVKIIRDLEKLSGRGVEDEREARIRMERTFGMGLKTVSDLACMHAYVSYEGEQHGFRRAKNIRRSLDAELYFYSKIFGFELANPVEPVQIENL